GAPPGAPRADPNGSTSLPSVSAPAASTRKKAGGGFSGPTPWPGPPSPPPMTSPTSPATPPPNSTGRPDPGSGADRYRPRDACAAGSSTRYEERSTSGRSFEYPGKRPGLVGARSQLRPVRQRKRSI